MPVMAVETASRPRRKVQGLTGSVADISSRLRTASRPSAFGSVTGKPQGRLPSAGQPPSVGHEAQEQRSRVLVGAFPDAEFSTEDLIRADDKVVAGGSFGALIGAPSTEFRAPDAQ
jgi:hypothetical protein